MIYPFPWLYSRLVRSLFRWYLRPKFGMLGRSTIDPPVFLQHPEHISIGNRVYVAAYSWIQTEPAPDGDSKPVLRIDDGTHIGHFCHITAAWSVTIGKSVLVADRVHISDAQHQFENVEIPIIAQGITQGNIAIGDHSWIGVGAAIFGNVRIGKHCVVGANAVVIRDVPDYTVVAGVPARPIKRLNELTGAWHRVDKA